MHKVLNNRFKMLNPSVIDFLIEEKVFYSNISKSLKHIENIDQTAKDLDRKFTCPDNAYDPCKFIRGGNVVQSVKENHNDDRRNKTVVNKPIKEAIAEEEDEDYYKKLKKMRETVSSKMPEKIM